MPLGSGPAPGNPWYEHGSKPGSPGSTGGQAKHEAVGNHPTNQGSPTKPGTSPSVNSEMSEGVEALTHQASQGKGGPQHGRVSGGPAKLNAQGGYPDSPQHAGKGRPASPG